MSILLDESYVQKGIQLKMRVYMHFHDAGKDQTKKNMSGKKKGSRYVSCFTVPWICISCICRIHSKPMKMEK